VSKGPTSKLCLKQKIKAIEVVSSCSCILAILKILVKTFGKELRHTMNTSECVARGRALQCVILSSTFKVREFKVCKYVSFWACFPQNMILLNWRIYQKSKESKCKYLKGVVKKL
jgi:molecular chaperone DnaK (HSP70)